MTPLVQVRKVARQGTGHTPSRSVPEYWKPDECVVPWLTLADVWKLRDGRLAELVETEERISPTGIANSSAVVHSAGTVAFSRTASVGYTCILGTDMATSQDFVTWTPGDRLDSRYLLWALRGLRDEILGRTQGSTHKTIYMPDLEQVAIPLPSLEEQRRIADHLDVEVARIDELIQAKRETAELLHRRALAQIDERIWTHDLAPLKRVADLLAGFTFPSEEFAPDADGQRLLRGVNIAPSGLRWDDTVFYFGSDPAVHRYRLNEGDLVLGMDRPFVGSGTRVAEVGPSEADSLLVQRVCRIRSFDPGLTPIIKAAIQSRRFVAHVEPDLTGVSVPHLSESQIGSYRIPVPPPDQLARLVSNLNASNAVAAEAATVLTEQIELLQERRRSLITAVVTGETEVP